MVLSALLYTYILIALSSSDETGNECTDAYECQAQEMSGSVLCYGYQSCESSSINSNYYVPCVGYKSCLNSNIISTNTIACDGDYTCSNAQLSSPDVLRCHGNSGCYGANIDAVNIIANGAYALNAATIESENQARVNLYSKGYLSGMNANVICRSGKKCNLYCAGNGCQDLNFACLGGSTCTVSPSICAPYRPNSKKDLLRADDIEALTKADVSDIACPNWYLSGSKHVDNLILNQIEDKKMENIKKMDSQNVVENKKDSLQFIREDMKGDAMTLFHSRAFGPRGSHQADVVMLKQNNAVLAQKEDVKSHVAYSNALLTEEEESGSSNKNEMVALDMHTLITLVIIFCSLLVILMGVWFCYKRHNYVKTKYSGTDSNALLDNESYIGP